ncbi:MAG TPA: hypothetical protein VHK69_10610 [Chitinophagaceae bacterium]|jgi:hypothetical protein|nr:hypothetical protein [Chitinophagaceae bacterium]
MESVNPYRVAATDRFQPDQYPAVLGELALLCRPSGEERNPFQAEIVISYLKDRCIRMDWIDANPQTASLLTCGCYRTEHIGYLFESCQCNEQFSRDYENYIKGLFTA